MKPIKLIAVEFLGGGYHLFINCTINGKRARLLVDTGASQTVVGKSVLDKLTTTQQATAGIHGSSAESHFGKIKALKLGALTIRNHNVTAISLVHINDSYKSMGVPLIKGILGADILMKYNCTIDFAKLQLHLGDKGRV